MLGFIMIVITTFAYASMDGLSEASAVGTTYYVSPDGDDGNPGTEEAPWKTLRKAAATLVGGDTAIFEDGVYVSNQAIRFSNNGEQGKPITIKARNQHQAKLMFENLNTTRKIRLDDNNYINIQDFEITQDISGTASADVFINIENGSNIVISGNSIHGAGGKAVQALYGSHIEIVHNELYDFLNIAVVLANIDRPIISHNEIRETDVVGIMVPAGTRSAQIYNNYIHAVEKPMRAAIILGGSYPASVAYDPDGYESYHAAAWNNIVVAGTPGLIETAFSFRGSTDSGYYNNIAIDTKHGIQFMDGGGSTAGWNPVTTSPKFYNNIFSGCTGNAIHISNPVNDPEHDYNLYYNCGNAPTEENGIYADPQFVDRYSDWNLEAESPARGSGTFLEVTGFYGETMSVPVDLNGQLRTEPTHMGVYGYGSQPELQEVLFTDDFENGDGAWTSQMGTLEIVEETPGGNKVFTDANASSSSGVNRLYAGSMDWDSYELETRVKFDQSHFPTSWLTLYTRYTSIRDYYLLEIQGERGYIALKKKVNGVVTPLQEKFNWYPPMGEWMDIRFVVDGHDVRVYINDKLELLGSETQLRNGAVAAAIYRSDILLDDVKVTKIEAEFDDIEPDPETVPGGTYYVSPTGSDMNPGTEEQPWRTMARAAELAQRGNTVIFEDGLYIETRPVSFVRGGTGDERIVFKARNKHQAVIKFQNVPRGKILMLDTPYITIQDFEITQDQQGTDTSDIFISAREGSDHVHVIGNKIHNAYEEGIKGYLVSDYLVEGNIIFDMFHEAIDFVNVTSSIIRNNEAIDIGRVGILAKGGSTDIQIYNNYVHNHNVRMVTGAIYLGGATGSASTKDPSVNGYEAWNVVAYNNVVVAEDLDGVPNITNGIAFGGSKDSAAYNNIVIGTRNGIYLYIPRNSSERVGWDWDPDNVNPVFMNNIIMNTTDHAVAKIGANPPINLVHDYNLYYNNTNTHAELEPNGVYANPLFVSLEDGDWHLQENSPAVRAGIPVPEFEFFDGQMMDISADYDGIARGDLWDIGIYRNVSGPAVEPSANALQQLVDDFAQSNAFANEQAVRALHVHLSAVEVFEQQEEASKVIKHMGTFKLLLDHQLDQEWISEDAHHELNTQADAFIEWWINY